MANLQNGRPAMSLQNTKFDFRDQSGFYEYKFQCPKCGKNITVQDSAKMSEAQVRKLHKCKRGV